MYEISEGQELSVDHLLSFRGKVTQKELNDIGRDMEMKIQAAGANKVGNPMTTIYSVDGPCMDLELLLPVNKVVENVGNYKYKDGIKIVNAAKLSYKGHPSGLQQACNELNQYIVTHKLQPITTGYNITKHIDKNDANQTEIDVYVGINPNVL